VCLHFQAALGGALGDEGQGTDSALWMQKVEKSNMQYTIERSLQLRQQANALGF